MKPDAFPGNLSLLQRELLTSFSRCGGHGFFLTGGAALVGYYGHDRITRDLDLFTRDHEAFEDGPHRLLEAAEVVGAVSAPVRTHPTFRRYRVTRGPEETLVDLVWEPVPAIHPPVPLPGLDLDIDVPDEIAVNKICAVVGRGEPRDLEDLHFLAKQGIDLEAALGSARAKDGGVGPDTLLMVLPDVPVSSTALREFRDDWVQRLRMGLLPPE